MKESYQHNNDLELSVIDRANMEPPNLSNSPEKTLLHIILENGEHATLAYMELIHKRYFGVVKMALHESGKKNNCVLEKENIIGPLYEHFLGRNKDWKTLKSFDDRYPFGTWLFVVVKNLVYKLIKKGTFPKCRESRAQEEAVEVLEEEGTGSNEEPMSPRDMLNLWGRVKALGERCAHILRLRYYMGWTDQQIAEKFGFKREWGNRQRKKCEQRLRDGLEGDGLGISDFV